MSRAFFARPADVVARDLLGKLLISDLGGARVVLSVTETEAYLGRDDPASHAYLGRLHDGNRRLYSPPGTWYVYRSYGIHWCLNVVTAPTKHGAAVLFRGGEIVEGLPAVRRRRGDVPVQALTNGPGKLCQALGIDRALDGLPMARSPVVVTRSGPVPEAEVRITPRIGITKAAEWPLRYWWVTRRAKGRST
ncbi:MAG: DNA-3-methyladenine glycosylase [Gemmatimonadota bacterium]